MSGPRRRTDEELRVSLRARVAISANGCWLWTGGLNSSGYATGGRVPEKLAHRASYGVFSGPISDGLEVCHDCDRFYAPGDFTYRRCINPDHLFLGTKVENARDCHEKGRGNDGMRNGNASISDERLARIRALIASGVRNVDVARLESVHPKTVCAIKCGKSRRTA